MKKNKLKGRLIDRDELDREKSGQGPAPIPPAGEGPGLLNRRMLRTEEIRPEPQGDAVGQEESPPTGGPPPMEETVPAAADPPPEPLFPEPVREEESIDPEERFEEVSIRLEEKQRKRERRAVRVSRLLQILLSIGCVYLIFLIYGVLITGYQYNEQGEIVPRLVTAEKIQALRDFEEARLYYEQAKSLYEQALTLDYHLAQGYEEPLLLAVEYEAMLDPISKLSVQVDAMEAPTRYNQIKSMLLAWIKSDIAVYIQNISAGISQNNAEKADHAIQDRDRMYQDFSAITQNLAAIGESVDGVDLTGLRDWTPDGFITGLEGIPYGG